MSRDLPPFERLPKPELAAKAEAPRRQFNRLLVFGIPVFWVFAMYLSLVVVSQLDDAFRPGNEFGLGFAANLPLVEDPKNPESADIEERINIVILGLDIRRDEPDDLPARTDSIMVLTIDPFAKTSGILSIPRDMWVEIPDGFGGFLKNRINVAFELGEYTYQDYPEGGAGLVKDTIAHNFDIPIDNYVVLNFNNFIELIDELGGIDINVPSYAYDAAYNDCNACPYYPVEFLPGEQHMDGVTALAYARIRKSDNDFRRIERQQLVVRATASKAMSLGTILSNPLGIYRQFQDSIDTDIRSSLLPGLAELAGQVEFESAPLVSLAPAAIDCGDACGGAAALLWDAAVVKELKAQVFTDGRLQKEGALVSVKNGTPTPNLASDFATFLSKQGMPSSKIAVDEIFDGILTDETAIYDLGGKDYTARKLADWLQIPYSRIFSGDGAEAPPFVSRAGSTDVIVVLGSDAAVPGSTSAGVTQIQTAGG